MANLVQDLAPLMQEYGYTVLALAIAVEGLGIPAPGQSLLIVASYLSVSGTFSLPAVLAVAGASSWLGNTAGYLVGSKFSHVVEQRGWLKPASVEKVHGFIDKYGVMGLVLSRFLEGLKQLMCLGCGMAQMPRHHFLIGNTLAVGIWLVVFGMGPAYFHEEIGQIGLFYHHHQQAFWSVAAIAGLALLFWFFRRRSPTR
ncbi:DedA family protein [Photobacterium galatheae]|uniref:Membrane protein n=1 Tax=Photobacterium galatheae TaxID=1654360 RepID=A0A066RJB6_9GAMM|nr:DedA family protein [Photobacterium galatheae]KDM90429.1 membrane protein [Photobacterium galatheae]MCM0147851.1 DedA family protein [Photobacterium galatheae]